jgi:glycosyltransferase involved in cell wall biosynthesis
VIPVYNGARYLRETLDSVLAQSWPVAEVLVVDDGSTDATAAIAREYGAAVRHLYAPHAGVSAARNRGVRAATQPLIAFLDADDLFLPDKTARQIARFSACPGLDMSAAHAVNFWSPDVAVEEQPHDPQMTTPFPRFICTWIVRRAVFEAVGGFDETMPLSQDVDWNIRVQASGARIETLPDVLVRRRLHAANVTRHARDRCRAAVLKSLRAHLRRTRG